MITEHPQCLLQHCIWQLTQGEIVGDHLWEKVSADFNPLQHSDLADKEYLDK